MKTLFVFLALLLVTPVLFAGPGNVASSDTVNQWYFWKAEGENQDSTWTYLTDSAIFGKSSQMFGLRSFGPTKYFWVMKLDRKYKTPKSIDIWAFLDTFTTQKTNNFFEMNIYLGNSDSPSNLYVIQKGGFSVFDNKRIFILGGSTDSVQVDSVDFIVFCFYFTSLTEKTIGELKIDDIFFDRTILVNDGGEPKFAKFKTTKPKVNFGAVAQGIKRVDSVLITNIGDAPLVISKIWTDNTHFSAKCSITTIAPQASTNVVVEFTQDSISGVKRGKLYIEHNGLSKLDSIELVADFMTSVGDEDHLPKEFSLSQNYPNPFNPNTTIKYSVNSKQYVKITVYDLLGKEISVLVNGEAGAGEHSVVFNAKNLSSGVYIYRIQTDSFVATKRMVLIK